MPLSHRYLRCTNLLLSISILYFLFNETKPIAEYVLASFLVATIIASQLFWENPVRGSTVHRIDAVIAKIVIFSCIFYTLVYKFKISFLGVLLAIAVSFYFSNYYSNKEWCCNGHIVCHGSLHVLCFIATFYTFAPPLF